ncbi:hypothetical protein ACFR9U_16890 [Halorientalis brevis]|uniref:Uncharacterized protein n=1 Tax=Halorientalis brevis TaxID=1126241 RepID=A0ABD6CHE5_9EURY|nr:hypothetical protein [Halorientalis brevis]
MSPPLQSLLALPLTAVDFATAGLLYELVSPSLGVLVGFVGLLLLCSIVYQLSWVERRHSI